MSNIQNKCLFLDRDGIINVDRGYVYKFEDIEFIPNIIDLIELANKNHYKVIVLTNQSGIAKGFYKESDVQLLHKQIGNCLRSLGATIDDWFYCVDFGDRRKPSPLMLYEARDKYQIDLSKSIMIGDKQSDVLDCSELKYFLLEGKYHFNNLPENYNISVIQNLEEVYPYLI